MPKVNLSEKLEYLELIFFITDFYSIGKTQWNKNQKKINHAQYGKEDWFRLIIMLKSY